MGVRAGALYISELTWRGDGRKQMGKDYQLATSGPRQALKYRQVKFSQRSIPCPKGHNGPYQHTYIRFLI